jgi:signal peptidase I
MSVKHVIKETRKQLKKKRAILDDQIVKKIEKDIDELKKVRKSGGKKKLIAARNRVLEDARQYLPKKIRQVIWEYFVSIGTAVLIAICIRHFIVEPFKIPSGSMIPTLMIKDKIVVNKFVYGPKLPFTGKRFLWQNQPRRWDIVVFTTRGIEKAADYPKNFVKRLVGLPGEELEIKDGELYVNGELVPKPEALQKRGINYEYAPVGRQAGFKTYDYALDIGFLGIHWLPKLHTERFISKGWTWDYGFEGKKFTVPEGHYFVLGDNSGASYDSRGWGFVPYENIKGKVICIWWPPGRVRTTK